jgi:hypothetical protein
VTAAIELHQAVDAFVATLATGPARSLRMHTGINSGLVVARRSDARAGDFALTGDAVNTAARLRGLAAPGEILVSESIWRQVADAFEGETAPPTEVKGKEQPLAAVRIVAARACARRRCDAAGRTRRGGARVQRRRRGVCRARARPRRRRSRRSRRRQVASRRRVRRRRGVARLRLPFGGGARLRLGDRARCRPQRRAQPSRHRRAGRRRVRRSALDRFAATRSLAAEQRLFLHDLLDIPPLPSCARSLRR